MPLFAWVTLENQHQFQMLHICTPDILKCFNKTSISSLMLDFQLESFQNQVLCYRQTTKGGELESLSPSLFHPATTVGVCLPLDPLAHKGLKRGETSDRTHASHTQPWLGFLYIYTHRGACMHMCAHTHTQKLNFVLELLQMSTIWIKPTSHLNQQIKHKFWIWLKFDKSMLQNVFFPPSFFKASVWFVEKVSLYWQGWRKELWLHKMATVTLATNHPEGNMHNYSTLGVKVVLLYLWLHWVYI